MKRFRGGFTWFTLFSLCFTRFVGSSEGTVTLSSSFSVSETYNDNLFFTEADREGDSSTAVGPSLRLQYSSPNFALAGNYIGSAQFHVRHPEANIYSQRASFDLDLPILSRQIRGMEVRVTEDVNYTPELPAFSFADTPATEPEQEEVTQIQEGGEGVQVRRTNTFRNRAGVDIGYLWTPLLRTNVFYTNVLTRHSGSELNDSVSHGTGIGANYQWSLQTDGSADYGYTVTVFREEDTVATHLFTTGIGHRFGPSLSMDGNIGVGFVEGESPRLILNAGLEERFKTVTTSLRYTSNVRTAGGLTATGTLEQRVVGQIARSVGQYTLVYLRAGYANNRSLSSDDLEISTYTVEGGAGTQFLSWLSGSVKYAYLNQQSQGTFGEDAQRNTVMAVLTASAPPWRIIK